MIELENQDNEILDHSILTEDSVIFLPEETAANADNADSGVAPAPVFEVEPSMDFAPPPSGSGELRPVDTFVEGSGTVGGGFQTTYVETKLEAHPAPFWAGRRMLSRAARASAIAAVAAIGGGAAVYLFVPPGERVIVERAPTANSAVTDVSSAEVFVSRAGASDAHAADPAGEQRSPASRDIRTTRAASPAQESKAAGEPQAPTQVNSAPRQEAKVAGMTIENPAQPLPRARCADGTFSYSDSASACAGRGGVAEPVDANVKTEAAPAKNIAYILGPRGGCYYLNSSNQKVYVDKKNCN